MHSEQYSIPGPLEHCYKGQHDAVKQLVHAEHGFEETFTTYKYVATYALIHTLFHNPSSQFFARTQPALTSLLLGGPVVIVEEGL